MRRLYKYTGILRGVDQRCGSDGFAGFVLWDHTCIQQKAPVRLAAVGGLGEYVQALYGSRAEERCLMAGQTEPAGHVHAEPSVECDATVEVGHIDIEMVES